jgi:hypothetical protein
MGILRRIPRCPIRSWTILHGSGWRSGFFDIPDNVDAHHVVFRKKFTVPAEWNHGKVSVFGKSESPGNCGIRRYMDGKPFGGQIVIDDLGGILVPGSTHVLTTEIWGKEPPLGTMTPAWITYRPDPEVQQALPDWSYAKDYLTYGNPAPLPGTAPESGAQRCEAEIAPGEAGHNVVLHVICNNAGISGIIFNGNFYASYGNIWNFMDINITPFVKFGKENEIVVLNSGKTTIEKATLDYYEKNVYP